MAIFRYYVTMQLDGLACW